MNDEQVSEKVQSAMTKQLASRGFVTPVDILLDLGLLTKANYELWRKGQVPYLEKVCNTNLNKLATVMKEMRAYAQKANLKPSVCIYKGYGKSSAFLKFSKSGSLNIEKSYATHFVDTKFCKESKA